MKPHLTIVREACIKAVPSIMELKFGCEVEEKPAFGSSFRNELFNGSKIFPLVHETNIDGKYLFATDSGFCYCTESEIAKWHKILGRPIRLADVLVAIGNPKFFIDAQGWIGEMVEVKPIKCVGRTKYNLLDDDLSHQSPETLEFLAGLLDSK